MIKEMNVEKSWRVTFPGIAAVVVDSAQESSTHYQSAGVRVAVSREEE